MRRKRATPERDDPAPRPADLGTRIHAVLADLSPAEKRIATMIDDDPARVAQLTVTELARQASTSAATVVRAAKSLGFEGYPQLRLALATHAGRTTTLRESGVPLVADIADGDDVAVMLTKMAVFECDQIMATAELAAPEAIEEIAARIAAAGRCCVVGIGASGLVAQDFVQKITRIGLNGYALTEHDAAVVAASLLGKDDVALAISHTGESRGAAEPLRLAAGGGAFTAAITGAARSTVARVADRVLITAGREFGLRSAAVGSRTSQLLLVDTLFARIAQLTPGAARSLQRTHDAINSSRGGTSAG